MASLHGILPVLPSAAVRRLLALLTVASATSAAEASAKVQSPKDGFLFHVGLIPDKFDIESKIMSPLDAPGHCRALEGCRGFTFEGPPGSERVNVFFKSGFELLPNKSPGYSSFELVSVDLSAQVNATALQVGEVLVYDDFLEGDDLVRAGKLIDNGVVVNSRNRVVLNATKFEAHASEEDGPFLHDLLGRIRQFAERNVYPVPDETDLYPFTGKVFVDTWILRRYLSTDPKFRQVQAHTDTEQPGRCMSATLHLGSEDGVEGGVLQTYPCPPGVACRRMRPKEAYSHFNQYEQRTDASGFAPYKRGRLVFFLSATPHAVTELTKGQRDILFIWMTCVPSLRGVDGNASLVKELLEARAPVNGGFARGMTPLHMAANSGHLSMADALLEGRADLTRKESIMGRTPLFAASEGGHAELITRLASARADVCTTTKKGATPLEEAEKTGHKQVKEALLAAGAGKCKNSESNGNARSEL